MQPLPFLQEVFESLIIGISIAAIPGPIFFELIRRTLSKGLRNGVLLVLGESTGNFLLMLCIFLGVSQFLAIPSVKTTFFFIGGAILLKLGISAFKLKKEEVEISYDKTIGSNKSFATGFIIAVTSPIVIALWISLSGSYLSYFKQSTLAFFHIFLISTGVLLFFLPLAFLIHLTRRQISPKVVVVLSKIFGTVLLAYGTSLFYKALHLLK